MILSCTGKLLETSETALHENTKRSLHWWRGSNLGIMMIPGDRLSSGEVHSVRGVSQQCIYGRQKLDRSSSKPPWLSVRGARPGGNSCGRWRPKDLRKDLQFHWKSLPTPCVFFSISLFLSKTSKCYRSILFVMWGVDRAANIHYYWINIRANEIV